MEDESGLPIDLKNLANLRVVDLKQELEKRGLSKSGSKKDLVKRLKQQLDFEERKHSSGDEDLKFQLDAVTEQNEFVQQYLAQKQKIFAEQKEAKRLSELGEIQKSSDEQEATDEASDSESPVKPSSKEGSKNLPEEEVPTTSEVNVELSVKDIEKSNENQVSSDNKDGELKKDSGGDVEESNTKYQIEKEKGHKITIKLHVKDLPKQKVEPLLKDNQTEDKSGNLAIKEATEVVCKSEDPALLVTEPEDTQKEKKVVPDAPDQGTISKPRGPSTPPYPCNSSEEIDKEIKMDEDAKSDVITNGKSDLSKDDISIKSTKSALQKEASNEKDMKDKKNYDSFERDEKPTLIKIDTKNESNENDTKSTSGVKHKDKRFEQKRVRSSRDKAKRSRRRDPRGSSSSSASSDSNERSREKKIVKSSNKKRSRSNSESASSGREGKRSHKTKESRKSRHKDRSSRSKSSSSERNVKKSYSKKTASLRKDNKSSRSESSSSEREINKAHEATRESSQKGSGDFSRSKKASSEREIKRIDDKIKKSHQVETRNPPKSKSTSDDRDMKKYDKIRLSRQEESRISKSVSREREVKKSHEKDTRSPSRSKSKSIDRDMKKSDDKIRRSHRRESRSPKSVSKEREIKKSHEKDTRSTSRSKSKSIDRDMKKSDDKIRLSHRREARSPKSVSKEREIKKSHEKDTRSTSRSKSKSTDRDIKKSDDKIRRSHQRESRSPKSVSRDHEKDTRSSSRSKSKSIDRDMKKSDDTIRPSHRRETRSPKSVSSEGEIERSNDTSRKSHKEDVKKPSRSKSKSTEKEIKQTPSGSAGEKDTNKTIDEKITRKASNEKDTQKENKRHSLDRDGKENLQKFEKSTKSHEKIAPEDRKETHMKDTSSPPRKKLSRSASSDKESQSDSSDTYSKNKLSKKRKTSKSTSSSESQESDNESGRNQKPLDKRKSSPVKNKEPTLSNSEASIATSKQRLKIKRDNVVVHVSSHSESKSATRDKISSRTDRQSDAARLINYRSTSSSHSENVEERMETVPKVECAPIPKYTSRKIALSNRKKSLDQEEPKSKRSKWGGLTSHQKQSQSICISSDSLKNWFPDLKLVSSATPEDEAIPVTPTTARPMEVDIPAPEPVEEFVPKAKEDKENIQFEDTGEASRFLLVENLVRPFTLNQLKDLLRQTGRFVEESFWIDKIKSKCIVTYETEDEALQTRLAVHNTRWPSSNPKILNIRYSSAEELENFRSGADAQKPTVPELKPAPVMEQHEMDEVKVNRQEDSHRRKERKHREPPMREWDRDKIVQESPERSIHHKKEDKKGKKHDIVEDTPAKLLDDLFQKTKSTPCIYWLPLTEEQIKERDAARQKRRTEREKVRQEQPSKGPRRSASRSPVPHRR